MNETEQYFYFDVFIFFLAYKFYSCFNKNIHVSHEAIGTDKRGSLNTIWQRIFCFPGGGGGAGFAQG